MQRKSPEERRAVRGLEALWPAIEGLRAAAAAQAAGSDARRGLMAAAARTEEEAEKVEADLGVPARRTRRLWFAVASRPEVRLGYDVTVVGAGRRTEAAPEVVREAVPRLRAFELANDGVLPLTEEEFRALTDGDDDRVVALARDPRSSLHPLFVWDADEAAGLLRQRQMHGDGN